MRNNRSLNSHWLSEAHLRSREQARTCLLHTTTQTRRRSTKRARASPTSLQQSTHRNRSSPMANRTTTEEAPLRKYTTPWARTMTAVMREGGTRYKTMPPWSWARTAPHPAQTLIQGRPTRPSLMKLSCIVMEITLSANATASTIRPQRPQEWLQKNKNRM